MTPPTKAVVTHPDGRVEETSVPPDDFTVILGQRCEITSAQFYGNGTTVLTIKPVPEAADG